MKEEKDPFDFCELGGCEGVNVNCINSCPYGENSGCPKLTRTPTTEQIQQCADCSRHNNCTKEDMLLFAAGNLKGE